MKPIDFLCFCFLILGQIGFAQQDYAIIKIYNGKKGLAAMGADPVVTFNGQEIADIRSGGKLTYKKFTEGPLKIGLVTPVAGYAGRKVVYQEIFVEKGKEYLFAVKLVPKLGAGYWNLVPITKAVKDSKLRKERFLELSEFSINENRIVKDHPTTNWTESALKQHWSENGADPIEGIYETLGKGIEYQIAVVNEGSDYKVIYVSGPDFIKNWKEGEVKGELQKTAQLGIFKCKWYTIDKYLDDNVLVTIDKAVFKKISETKKEESVFLKLYPTYEGGVSQSPATGGWKGNGTGFFIDKNGYIATNHHVVEKSSVFEVDVTKNGVTQSYSAELISKDVQNDLAILKINSPGFQPLKALNYNFNTTVQDVGTAIYSLGFPLVSIMGNEIKFTDGRISAKSGYQGNVTTYQITAPIQPGNSGGPLFSESGSLVGITSSGLDRKIADNANYAIKTVYLRLLVEATDAPINLPDSQFLTQMGLEEQIKTLSEYVVLIKVK